METNEQLADRISKGDESAYLQLLAQTTRCIWKAARFWGHRFCLDQDRIEDLHQEGMLVMLEAARRFDVGRGLKFMTFLVSRLRKLAQVAREFRMVHVPADLGDSRAAKAMHDAAWKMQCFSIDAPRDANNPRSTIASGLVGRVDAPHADRAMLCIWLDRLEPRDREIVYERARGVTLKVLAIKHGLSRERISQLEKRAMASLRRMAGV